MLKQPMIEKLAAMRLLGMVEALKTREQDPSARELSFLERFGLLVDQQWNWREMDAFWMHPLGPRTQPARAIFTAIQEQLGLKLEPARGPVQVLVIDSIERPSEN